MKIFVTGGAGFIGSNFIKYWFNKYPNDFIIIFDKLTYSSSLDRLRDIINKPNITFIQGDINDFDLLCKSLTNVDLIVNFAAETHVDRSLTNLESQKVFNKSNIDGTLTLLHVAFKLEIKRFHHVSTDEVFGDLGYDSDNKFHENYPYNPHNPYSISKATSDFFVRFFYNTYGLPITISNCSNNYGPYQTPEKLIPRSIILLLQNKKVELYTDKDGNPGKNIRDWLFVSDHCEAIDKIIKNGKIGETYCIGGNNEISNYNIIKKILDIINEINYTSFTFDKNVELVKDRPGHDKRYAINAKKIETELNWLPKYTFEEGINYTIKWYLSEEGKTWLKSLENCSTEVRKNQSKKIR